jgi:hypothetical protein
VKKSLDALKPAEFGRDFAGAFGDVGKAIDKAGKALDQYSKRMNALGKIRKDALNIKDDKERGKALEELRDAELKSSLDMYADMAGSVKGFFKEKTVAYKAFDALETGMRVAQIALTWKETTEKIAAAWTVFTQKQVTTQASIALDNAETASSTTNSFTKAMASTVAGVGKAFEQMGIWGFIGAAAILAFMGSLGVGGGGGGGSVPNLSEERQKRNGTGTVLGDDEAKSESIKNSLERMRDNSNIGLVYTSEMLASLRNIDLKMGGLTASVARTPGLTTGKNFNANIGTSSSGIQGLFGKTTTRQIADTGLLMNGRIADLLNNRGLQQYLDVVETTTKSGFLGFGGGTKSSTSRQYQGVDSQLSAYIGGIFQDISDTIVHAGTSLGLSGDEMQKRLNEFVLNAEISLKDLRGDDLQKALEAFFSASADQLAMWTAGAFSQFQKSGEGYFETLTRVATQTERAKDAISKLGIQMTGLWDVQNKTGDIDVELVRQSLIRHEAGTTLANIMRLIDGSMEDLIANYKELTRIRNMMQSMGANGNSLSLDLIRGAGGIRELADAFDSYSENFFSQQEQTQMKMAQLTMEFGRLGIAVPQSRNAFRNLVTQLLQSGAAGEEMAGRILSLSETFSEAMEMYDETNGQLVTDARDALSEAYDRESEALENTRQKMQDFANSLKEFKDSLITGDLSPLSAMEKYQTALAKYDEVSMRALAGDQDAIAEFQGVATELLKFSQEVNASGSGYMSDFNRVLNATEALGEYTQGQATQAETELSVLKTQVETLIDIDESVKTVAQAIAELLAVMGGGSTSIAGLDGGDTSLPTLGDGSTAAPLTVPTAETNAAVQAAQSAQQSSNLISEVQGLRTELVALRTQAKSSADAQLTATYDATDKAADKVVDGLDGIDEKQGWRSRLYTASTNYN